MLATKQRKRKTAEAPKENNTILFPNSARKATDKVGGRRRSRKGRNSNGLSRNDPDVLPFTAVQALGHQEDALPEETKQGHKVLPKAGILPSEKIKLQLFPIDEVTRMGLERDGHNPYLELTLRARKKISAVIEHLNNKWGSSSIAVGELMLFPYNIQLEKLITYKRWSINDSCSSAGDVYADIESPALFRLRYGWFSNLESRISKLPPRTTLLGVSFESEGIRNSCGSIAEVYGDIHRKLGNTSEVVKPRDALKAADAKDDEEGNRGLTCSGVPWDDSLTNLSIGGLLSDASLVGKINNYASNSKGMKSNLQPIQLLSSDVSIGSLLSEASRQGKNCDTEVKLSGADGNFLLPTNDGTVPSPVPWDDSFTTLSIGGLVSVPSLQADVDTGHKSGSPPTKLISDSFDAFGTGKIRSQYQASKLSSQSSHVSILDAEETCHAFSFGKSSLSGKDGGLSGSAILGSHNNAIELNVRGGLLHDPFCQDSKAGPLAHPKLDHSESSLGLGGINWTESLGPLDISFTNLRQIKSEDSVSISEFVR